MSLAEISAITASVDRMSEIFSQIGLEKTKSLEAAKNKTLSSRLIEILEKVRSCAVRMRNLCSFP